MGEWENGDMRLVIGCVQRESLILRWTDLNSLVE